MLSRQHRSFSESLVHSHFMSSLFTVYHSGQFHPAAPSEGLYNWCRWSARCLWCSRPRTASVHRPYDLSSVLVIIDVPYLPRTPTETHPVYNRTYVTPLLSGYLADEKWGRFKAIVVSVGIVLVGHIVLIISSIPPVIAHPKGALAALSLAIIIIGLGTGGFKANISPLVAEQQQHLRPFISQTTSGERVVVNPSLTTSRIYMVRCLISSLARVVSMTDFIPSISTSSSTLAEWSARSP